MSSRNLKRRVAETPLVTLELKVPQQAVKERADKTSPVGSVQPSHTEGLEHHHDDEGQSGRVVVEHGHKVVPAALREDEADEEADDAAENCHMGGKKMT